MADRHASVNSVAYPIVAGKCPACGYGPLFLGAGGYVTCSWIKCPEPDAATNLLEGKATR